MKKPGQLKPTPPQELKYLLWELCSKLQANASLNKFLKMINGVYENIYPSLTQICDFWPWEFHEQS